MGSSKSSRPSAKAVSVGGGATSKKDNPFARSTFAPKGEAKQDDWRKSEVMFNPSVGDSITKKLDGQRLKLSANTITVKGDNNKTKGMVRNISRVSANDSPKGRMALHKFQQKSGVDLRQFGMDNIYTDGKKIYVLNDLAKVRFYSGPYGKTNKAEYKRYMDRNKQLKKAENNGAYVVNYYKGWVN